MQQRILLFLYTALLVAGVLLLPAQLHASGAGDADFRKLAHEISDASNLYYQEAAEELKNTHYIKRSLRDLKRTVTRLIEAKEHALANAVILANFSLIKKNIDNKSMPFFLAQLLEHNIWQGAQSLADTALARGSLATKSEVHYLLGEYYFAHDDLDQSIKHLTAIETSRPLTQDERDYATLIFGIALQKEKKHRQALKIYQKIEKGSSYFGNSRLNMAIAHIRQEWWTDAQIAIDEALEVAPPKGQQEINNRLLLVLGYSQLQNEFYRNARETFRKISLNSEYMNRALHGIGLCAISQKDYLGAINAFTRLRNSDGDELVVLESHLLIPYTYNRVGDLEKAAIGYSEAIAFYENIAREMDAHRLRLNAGNRASIDAQAVAGLPPHMQESYRMLTDLNAEQSSPAIQAKIQTAKNKLHHIITDTLIVNLDEKSKHVKSYLSQSQYGLAKLYDTP